LIFVSAAETSVVPLGTYSVASTWKPSSLALSVPPCVAVLENPSSAEMNASVFGFGFARSDRACTMLDT